MRGRVAEAEAEAGSGSGRKFTASRNSDVGCGSFTADFREKWISSECQYDICKEIILKKKALDPVGQVLKFIQFSSKSEQL